jgi:membrane protease YdiL (CAAX protease family)
MAAGRDVHALGAQAARLAARGDRATSSSSSRSSGSSGRLPLVLLAYLLAGLAAGVVAVGIGRSPFVCDGWLGVRGAPAVLLSLGLGVILGASTTFATRALVRRFRWARALHRGLRPAVQGAGDSTLATVAVASAVGEELLFRGLLVPAVGVVASSLVFGTLHQIRGPARWAWMGWATVMGLLFGAVFAATGSLAGPLVAHVAINHANLRFLRDAPSSVKRVGLGGLLRRP